MQRLSTPLAEIGEGYDAIVIGSGYGGGVAASRLARMGYQVAVLERGDEIHPGEFPDTAAKAMAHTQIDGDAFRKGDGTELYDLHIGKDINVLVGCGLGGTSLINANVALEADPRVFADPAWPEGLTDEDLAEGYRRARAMLQPQPYPAGARALNKLRAMEAAAQALGAHLDRPPINVTFEEGYNAAGVWQEKCNLCGDCCSGCNVGAKNTVLMNYLPDALAFKAKIFCNAGVDWIERNSADGWTVGFTALGLGREAFDRNEQSVRAKIVVLAAGTLGSTGILLRSRARGLKLSPALGTRFSGNGDVLAFGYNNDRPIDGIGLGHRAAAYDPARDSEHPVGPTITGLIDLRATPDLGDAMVIEEGSIPGGLATFIPAAMALGATLIGRDTDGGDLLSEKMREVESLTLGAYRGAIANSQTFLVMSHDGSDGRIELEDGRVRVRWPGVGERPGFERVAEKLEAAVSATGGTYLPNPIWTPLFGHDLVTVHPLGGCPMGRDASVGVVDGDCRVFASEYGTEVHPDLFICDGAVLPRSLGVNPLLTISAVAERALIRLARAKDRTIDMTSAPRQAGGKDVPTLPGIRFTERMAGTMQAANDGPATPASFVVTVIADDAARLIEKRTHEAQLIGTVDIPALSANPLTIVGGRWNLFIDASDRVETKQMVYSMPLIATDGRLFFMGGRKLIHDDKGFDLWRDTTTLFAALHEGADASGSVLFEGALRIDPSDLVRQFGTLTVTGAPDFRTRAATLAKFGTFFGGALFQAYGGPFARTSAFDPAAVRLKRPLRAGAPEIHHFDTPDGKTLRFTRYRGGEKGPVILSHGLGVSSQIFTIDTIDTNLLEYLVAAGYDCWLLDYRASIDLGYAREAASADDIAEKDYPAAVAFVREQTGSASVQMIAHCYGAMTFTMAMLRGLEGVRAAVISQISAHADVPWWPQRMLAWLHAPDLMHIIGVKLLDARATTDRNLLAHAIDSAIGLFYPFRSDDRTRSLTSRRITALYGQLYQLDQLNQATMDAMPEMFGKSNMRAFQHLTRIARVGHVVRADGRDDYLGPANLAKFAIPTMFVHGAQNRTFAPSGTKKTLQMLSAANGANLYSRVEIAETGHIDCIFGKSASRDVFPHIVRHLDCTSKAIS